MKYYMLAIVWERIGENGVPRFTNIKCEGDPVAFFLEKRWDVRASEHITLLQVFEITKEQYDNFYGETESR
jgi:hypothetical protein